MFASQSVQIKVHLLLRSFKERCGQSATSYHFQINHFSVIILLKIEVYTLTQNIRYLRDFSIFQNSELLKLAKKSFHWNQFHVKSSWQKNWSTFLSDPIVMNEPVSFKGTLRLGGVPNYRDIWLIDLSIYGLPHEKKQSETKALTEVLNEWPNQDCPLRYVAWNPSTYLGLREQKLWGIL